MLRGRSSHTFDPCIGLGLGVNLFFVVFLSLVVLLICQCVWSWDGGGDQVAIDNERRQV